MHSLIPYSEKIQFNNMEWLKLLLLIIEIPEIGYLDKVFVVLFSAFKEIPRILP
jgi:hypothetical protein